MKDYTHVFQRKKLQIYSCVSHGQYNETVVVAKTWRRRGARCKPHVVSHKWKAIEQVDIA